MKPTIDFPAPAAFMGERGSAAAVAALPAPCPPGFRRTVVAVGLVLLGTGVSLQAASTDKPDRPSRAERIERRLERGGGSPVGSVVPARGASVAPVRMLGVPAGAARVGDRNRLGAPFGADSFDAFQLVVDRNIFDPTRIAHTRRSAAPAAARVDTITLVGTLESQTGTVAFLESALPDYRRPVHRGDTVGEFTVGDIQPDHVVLIRGGHPLSLAVAQQLRRPEGGEWAVADAPAANTPTGGDIAGSAPAAPEAPAAIPANASDVLRRLMEQRQKQLKQ